MEEKIIIDFKNFFDNEIKFNTVEKMFSNLLQSDKNILLKYYKNLLIIIYYSFFNLYSDDFDIFKKKMSQNDYRDSKSILLLLLPYINTNDNIDTNNIISFNDLVKNKNKNLDQERDQELDTNKIAPNYTYTNFQYGRIPRSGTPREMDFTEEFIKHNYLFLINTIKQCANKLFVNWVDVVPYDMITYKNSPLYINTLDRYYNNILTEYDFYKMVDISITPDLISRLQSLTIGDIYETITNELYYQVKKVKWLLYDIYNKKTRISLPLILVFKQKLDIQFVFVAKWHLVSKNIKNKFKQQWNAILENTTNSANLRIINSFGIFFINYYKEIEKLKSNSNTNFGKKYAELNTLDIANIDEINDDNNEDAEIDYKTKKIISMLREVDIEHIYTFIKDSLEILKLTWYSKRIFIKNKKNQIDFKNEQEYLNNKPDNITYKNIYNFAKSFCHVNNFGKFTMLPRYWVSLDSVQKNIIQNRLYKSNIANIMDWFNISNNLKRIGLSGAQTHIKIFNFMQSKLIQFVFESMIMRGTLSRLVHDTDLTDKNITNIEQIPEKLKDTIFRTTEDNEIWTHGYYFATACTYQDMAPVDKTYISEDTIQDTNYFEYNSSPQGRNWYSAYALHWTAQINFFHKFLNNRIIYATGATGVGKSTQIPKLLLYAMKAILYNSTTRIICTQPRQKPTENNAKTIAEQMGVPIEIIPNKNKDQELNLRYKNNIPENYVIQFKHHEKKHTKNTHNINMSLKISTDGILTNEMNGPILKIEPHNVENLYDIVIIDEAHEHNTNMDIILSLMKTTVCYNNSIKLVIISATMNNDEPIYRRFYRDINDNRMHPINYYLKENNLDRINIDRRLDISEPGQTTKHEIIEYYIDEIKNQCHGLMLLNLDLDLNLEENKIPYIKNLISCILDKSSAKYERVSKNDILIFQQGEREVNKLVSELNKFIPSNVIALPYYSKLPDILKNYLINFNEYRDQIHIDKSKLEQNEIINIESDDIQNGGHYYDQFIIVGTNIIEASVTIDSLYYVIDNGIQKTNKYNPILRNNKLEPTIISESSRIQRKGRVGRTQSGEVYFLYKKGYTVNIKSQFGICNDDITENLYKILSDDSDESILLNIDNDPNSPNISISGLMYGKFEKSFSSYYNLNNFFDYFGNSDHYDYDNYENIIIYHDTGYSYYNIIDPQLKFYIVHPDELEIKRNIFGTVIESTNPDNILNLETFLKDYSYTSYKLNIFIKNLENDSSLYLDLDRKIIRKLDIGKKLYRLKEIFGFEDSKLFKILMYSFGFNVPEQILRLISMLEVLGQGVNFTQRLFTKKISKTHMGKLSKKPIIPIEYIKSILGNEIRGDFEGILTLLEYCHSAYNNIGIQYCNNNIYDKSSDLFKRQFSDDFINEEPQDRLKLVENLKLKLIDTDIDNFTTLTDEQYLSFRFSDYFIKEYIMKKSYYLHKDRLLYLYDKFSLKEESMDKYFEKYNKYKNMIYLYWNEYLLDMPLKGDYKLLLKLSSIIKIKYSPVKTYDNYEKIISCFVFANPYNIINMITDSGIRTKKFGIYLYSPKISNIYRINSYSQTQMILETFVNNKYLTQYLHYYNIDLAENTVSLVNYIHPKIFSLLTDIYNLGNLGTVIKNLLIQDSVPNTEIPMFSGIYKKKLEEIHTNIIKMSSTQNTEIYDNNDIAKIFNRKIIDLI